jgi:hypothetical protein
VGDTHVAMRVAGLKDCEDCGVCEVEPVGMRIYVPSSRLLKVSTIGDVRLPLLGCAEFEFIGKN